MKAINQLEKKTQQKKKHTHKRLKLTFALASNIGTLTDSSIENKKINYLELEEKEKRQKITTTNFIISKNPLFEIE